MTENSKVSFPVYVIRLWSEFDKKEMTKIEQYIFPAFTIQQTVQKIEYENNWNNNSEEMKKLCSSILLKKKQLIDENTIELGIYLLSHLKNDFHNIAAHRFFVRRDFPYFLKNAGIAALKTDEQKLSLLSSMRIRNEKDSTAILKETYDLEEKAADGETIDLKGFTEEALSITAHKNLPEHMYEELLSLNIPSVNRSLAYNSNVSSELLKKIYHQNNSNSNERKDENLSVIIASNPSLDNRTAEELLLSNLYDRAAKSLVLKSDVDKEKLFESALTMKDIPWHVIRGLATDFDISYDLVQAFFGTPVMKDCEAVFNLLSNPSIDETTKEFLSLDIPRLLVVH